MTHSKLRIDYHVKILVKLLGSSASLQTDSLLRLSFYLSSWGIVRELKGVGIYCKDGGIWQFIKRVMLHELLLKSCLS
jgi:hypothetical protein